MPAASSTPLDAVLATARAWSGVAEGASRVGARGVALFASGREFLHVHTPTRIDVRVTKAHERALRGDAHVIARRKPSDWIEVIVDDASGTPFAIEVARIAWHEATRPAAKKRSRG